MPAASDCELIRDTFLAQPVNAVSSLAFLAVGLLLLRSRPTMGVAVSAVGIGSFLFHGPMPGWAEWAHDVTLASVLLALVLEEEPRMLMAAVSTIAIGFALWLPAAEPVTALIAGGASVVVAKRLVGRSTRWRTLALTSLAAGLAVLLTSRTGGPLCEPTSLLQGHAAWHLLAAVALVALMRINPRGVPIG